MRGRNMPRPASYWTLAMTLAWIVWRDMEEVRRWDPQWLGEITGSESLPQWRKLNGSFRFNAKHFEAFGYISSYRYDRQSFSMAKETPESSSALVRRAKSDLWEALAGGRMHGYALPFPVGARIKIPSHEWVELSNQPKTSAFSEPSQSKLDEDFLCNSNQNSRIVYSKLLFIADEVEECFGQFNALKGTINKEREAERELRAQAQAHRDGQGGVPVRAHWAESCGLGPRAASRVWPKVAMEFPELSGLNKPKRRRKT